ncbi:MAG: glutamate-5-semialdehyde dehydrogenase [Clostridia bacterium]|nr:glutamate-5-semialdehyde dehydrogenase [Clostridia bacterium]
MTTTEQIALAVLAKPRMMVATVEERNRALLSMADALETSIAEILSANEADIAAAREKISEVMIDRLRLTEARVHSMAEAVRKVAQLPDPVGRILEETKREDGLFIRKVSVPIGVLAMIYESRPNVTSDAAALSIKTGNVCVLRGGKEAAASNRAITAALRAGLVSAGLPEDAITLIMDTSRASATELMTAVGKIDLLIPRGGAGLIRACVENAKVPCIETGTGICHIYIDKDANAERALAILENAKTSRPSVCNAAEVCLVHKDRAAELLPKIYERLVTRREAEGKTPVTLRLDAAAAAIISGENAGENDFDTEFLDYTLAIAVVDSVESAIAHIAAHSTGHSEAIVTENTASADAFTLAVDSAAVYVNASTRFTDGGEFGLGCEMGISTQKMHARGPMGLRELTSYKYIITGNGHIRV